MSETRQQAERARQAYFKLATADRTQILKDMARAIRDHSEEIFAANKKDLEAAQGNIAPPLYKRLVINEPKLRDLVDGIEQLASDAGSRRPRPSGNGTRRRTHAPKGPDADWCYCGDFRVAAGSRGTDRSARHPQRQCSFF